MGLIAERRGDLERALRLYAQVQSGENAVPALLRAAALLQAHGAAPAAEELLDQLIEDEPQRAPGNSRGAGADLRESRRCRSRRSMCWTGPRASIRTAWTSAMRSRRPTRSRDRSVAALRELRQVLKSRPDDPAALNAYGYTWRIITRELAHARTLIERAYAAAPKNAAILDSLGWVLFRQGQPKQGAAVSDRRLRG